MIQYCYSCCFFLFFLVRSCTSFNPKRTYQFANIIFVRYTSAEKKMNVEPAIESTSALRLLHKQLIAWNCWCEELFAMIFMLTLSSSSPTLHFNRATDLFVYSVIFSIRLMVNVCAIAQWMAQDNEWEGNVESKKKNVERRIL